jgi:hypothetical protein
MQHPKMLVSLGMASFGPVVVINDHDKIMLNVSPGELFNISADVHCPRILRQRNAEETGW